MSTHSSQKKPRRLDSSFSFAITGQWTARSTSQAFMLTTSHGYWFPNLWMFRNTGDLVITVFWYTAVHTQYLALGKQCCGTIRLTQPSSVLTSATKTLCCIFFLDFIIRTIAASISCFLSSSTFCLVSFLSGSDSPCLAATKTEIKPFIRSD